MNFIGPFPSGPEAGRRLRPRSCRASCWPAPATRPTPSPSEYLVSSASPDLEPGLGGAGLQRRPGTCPAGFRSRRPPTAPASRSRSASAARCRPASTAPASTSPPRARARRRVPTPFNLVKVDGQWRITNPPDYRMLTASDFQLFYKAQDLYFFDPQDADARPRLGVRAAGRHRVAAAGQPGQRARRRPQDAVAGKTRPTTEFPPGTTVLGVTVAGSTVTVNLGGQARQRHRAAARAVLRRSWSGR